MDVLHVLEEMEILKLDLFELHLDYENPLCKPIHPHVCYAIFIRLNDQRIFLSNRFLFVWDFVYFRLKQANYFFAALMVFNTEKKTILGCEKRENLRK